MTSSFVAYAQEIRVHPQNLRPHVVVLGAGASCAAFPKGEANGRCLPVMQNFIDMIGLRPLLDAMAPELIDEPNIEVVYPMLLDQVKWKGAAQAVEQKIREYFSKMALPDSATIYDRLVLALVLPRFHGRFD